jgi:hypothetical protein
MAAALVPSTLVYRALIGPLPPAYRPMAVGFAHGDREALGLCRGRCSGDGSDAENDGDETKQEVTHGLVLMLEAGSSSDANLARRWL